MPGTNTQPRTYHDEIAEWRQRMDERLRAEDGWLTLAGLYWLREGENTVGAAPTCDVALSEDEIPPQLGTISFVDGQASLQMSVGIPVLVDGVETAAATLRDDTAQNGSSLVKIGSITFFIIRRGDAFGVRVRDTNHPDRLAFTGRKWFPVDEQYRLKGSYIQHTTPRYLQIVNSAGQNVTMQNPGRVEFPLHGQLLSLEAFSASDNEVWFVFKDATSGKTTYGAGRFLYAPITADGFVTLDFNKAYHPPCAYTPYATCPLPPKGNVLPVDILAGEHS